MCFSVLIIKPAFILFPGVCVPPSCSDAQSSTQGRKRQVSSSSGKTSCIYPPSVPGYVSHTKSFNFTTFISFHLYAFVIPINLPSCAVIYWHLPSTTFINPHIPLSTFIVQVLRTNQINDTRMKLSQIVKGPKGNIF